MSYAYRDPSPPHAQPTTVWLAPPGSIDVPRILAGLSPLPGHWPELLRFVVQRYRAQGVELPYLELAKAAIGAACLCAARITFVQLVCTVPAQWWPLLSMLLALEFAFVFSREALARLLADVALFPEVPRDARRPLRAVIRPTARASRPQRGRP